MTQHTKKDDYSVDPIDRCGVGLFSLPENSSLTDACKVHDYMYSSPQFQQNYTRKEADDAFYKHLLMVGATKVVATAMWGLARVFGRFFWEGKK